MTPREPQTLLLDRTHGPHQPGALQISQAGQPLSPRDPPVCLTVSSSERLAWHFLGREPVRSLCWQGKPFSPEPAISSALFCLLLIGDTLAVQLLDCRSHLHAVQNGCSHVFLSPFQQNSVFGGVPHEKHQPSLYLKPTFQSSDRHIGLSCRGSCVQFLAYRKAHHFLFFFGFPVSTHVLCLLSTQCLFFVSSSSRNSR